MEQHIILCKKCKEPKAMGKTEVIVKDQIYLQKIPMWNCSSCGGRTELVKESSEKYPAAIEAYQQYQAKKKAGSSKLYTEV